MTTDEAPESLQIVLVDPEGNTERLVVESDRALVGSGAHCDVRLPPQHAAIEHVSLSIVEGCVHAHARAFDPYPTIDGRVFVRSPVGPESVLGVGGVKIQVGVRQAATGARATRRAARASPVTYAIGALGLVAGVFMVAASRRDDATQAAAGPPPALWSEPVRVCPQAAHDAAMALAAEKLNAAGAKRERRPFHVQDGVAAVPLFETAAACFDSAGQSDAAAEAASAARDLRAKVNEDYHVHQVRLEHALTINDYPSAQREVKVLRALTEGRVAPYVVWLSNLDRRLALQLGRKGAS